MSPGSHIRWRLHGLTVCVCFRSQQMFARPSASWRKLAPSCRWTSWSAGREFCDASASPAPPMWSRSKGELHVKSAGRERQQIVWTQWHNCTQNVSYISLINATWCHYICSYCCRLRTTALKPHAESRQVVTWVIKSPRLFLHSAFLFPVLTSCCWRRWCSTVSSTTWRWSRPRPCCPASSSRRTYGQTHTYKTNTIPLTRQILSLFPNAEINSWFSFPHTHILGLFPCSANATETWGWRVFDFPNDACSLSELIQHQMLSKKLNWLRISSVLWTR